MWQVIKMYVFGDVLTEEKWTSCKSEVNKQEY